MSTHTIHHAMILAAGFGTRLRPLTNSTPKPLIEVMAKPLITYALDHCFAAGIQEVVINTHYHGALIEKFIGDHYKNMRIQYSHESQILGTGGGIRKMAEYLDLSKGPILILNSDALCNFNIQEMIAAHHYQHQKFNAKATLLLQQRQDQHDYGVLKTDQNQKILHFVDRANLTGEVTHAGMFLGAHIMETELLSYLELDQESCVNRQCYPKAMLDGHALFAHYTKANFSDVGTLQRLAQSSFELLDGRFGHQYFSIFKDWPQKESGIYLDQNVTIAKTAKLIAPLFIGKNTRIRENTVIGPYAIIGNNCEISENSKIKKSIVASATKLKKDSVLKDCYQNNSHILKLNL